MTTFFVGSDNNVYTDREFVPAGVELTPRLDKSWAFAEALAFYDLVPVRITQNTNSRNEPINSFYVEWADGTVAHLDDTGEFCQV